MTRQGQVHARGRRAGHPTPQSPLSPEAVRGRIMPPVPRTDPPLSFADLVRRGTRRSWLLALFPLCKNAAFPEKEGDWLLSWYSSSPAMEFTSAERRSEQAEAHEKSQTPRLGCPCGQALSPLLASLSHVCLHSAHRLSSSPEWMEGHSRSLGLQLVTSLWGSDLKAGRDFIQACEQIELDRIFCFV